VRGDYKWKITADMPKPIAVIPCDCCGENIICMDDEERPAELWDTAQEMVDALFGKEEPDYWLYCSMCWPPTGAHRAQWPNSTMFLHPRVTALPPPMGTPANEHWMKHSKYGKK
jgi:hypothetical protein